MSSNTYSYSKIDTYQQCPFKFKLTYVDGHYSFSNSISTELGTAIHKCEEQIALAIQQKNNIDYITLKNELIIKMAELQQKYLNDFHIKDKSNRTVAEKIYYYLETGIYKLEQYMKEHPTYEIVGIEKYFKFTYKTGQTLNGYIDRIFHDTATDSYLVQDIKTYAVEVEHDKLVTPLQFVIYTLAVKELYNCDIEKISCQYYLPFCDLTQDAGTLGYVVRGTTKMEKIFEQININNFKANPSPLCNWCPFCKLNPDLVNNKDDTKFLCPYFSHWERTTRDRHDITKVENDWMGLENHEKIMEGYLKQLGKTELKFKDK